MGWGGCILLRGCCFLVAYTIFYPWVLRLGARHMAPPPPPHLARTPVFTLPRFCGQPACQCTPGMQAASARAGPAGCRVFKRCHCSAYVHAVHHPPTHPAKQPSRHGSCLQQSIHRCIQQARVPLPAYHSWIFNIYKLFAEPAGPNLTPTLTLTYP